MVRGISVLGFRVPAPTSDRPLEKPGRAADTLT